MGVVYPKYWLTAPAWTAARLSSVNAELEMVSGLGRVNRKTCENILPISLMPIYAQCVMIVNIVLMI